MAAPRLIAGDLAIRLQACRRPTTASFTIFASNTLEFAYLQAEGNDDKNKSPVHRSPHQRR